MKIALTKESRADSIMEMLDNQLLRFFSPLLLYENENSKFPKYYYACFYGCDTLSVTLTEKHTLEAFENKMLTKMIWK
jgi:hypothetical protein